jgi:hypothetical protein
MTAVDAPALTVRVALVSAGTTRPDEGSGRSRARHFRREAWRHVEAGVCQLLSRLAGRGVASATVTDLAAGSVILSRCVVEAGFERAGFAGEWLPGDGALRFAPGWQGLAATKR